MREGNKQKKRERKIASRETVVPITINCLTKKNDYINLQLSIEHLERERGSIINFQRMEDK